jgi:hypothetical protein
MKDGDTVRDKVFEFLRQWMYWLPISILNDREKERIRDCVVPTRRPESAELGYLTMLLVSTPYAINDEWRIRLMNSSCPHHRFFDE